MSEHNGLLLRNRQLLVSPTFIKTTKHPHEKNNFIYAPIA